MILLQEERSNNAPFLVSEIIEVIKTTYPAKLKVWYYCTIKRNGSIYGNGIFVRMGTPGDPTSDRN